MESHLLQMRGLKLVNGHNPLHRLVVASFTDAWIETYCILFVRTQLPSHLLQMRGLKLRQ